MESEKFLSSGIRNPEIQNLGFSSKESGIPLTFHWQGIQDLESRIHSLKSGIQFCFGFPVSSGDVSWKDHISRKEWGPPSIFHKFSDAPNAVSSGLCWRSKNETVLSQLLLSATKNDRRSRGCPATTFINQLKSVTGLTKYDLPFVMANRRE